MASKRKALIAGASGLVGSFCLKLLLADPMYDSVTVIGRKRIPIQDKKLNQHEIDFDHLRKHAKLFSVDDVFCCLGTTIKEAGSKEVFMKVDFAYVYDLAKLSAKTGVQQFLLISPLGANPTSIVFYNRVKGMLEKALTEIPIAGIKIFRPSLLLGIRKNRRSNEEFIKILLKPILFLLKGSLKRYKPIQAETVAAAMVNVAKENRADMVVFESDEIQQLAGCVKSEIQA